MSTPATPTPRRQPGAPRHVPFSLVDDRRPSLRSGLPFGAVAWGVLISELVGPAPNNWWVLAAAALCLVVVSVAFVVVTRRPDRTWLDPAVAYLFCAFVVLVRDAGGGAQSGVSSLYLVPVLWLALTGTRAEMLKTCALVGLCLVVPMLAIGDPSYPSSDWRRAFVTVALGLAIGGVAQWAVNQMRAESRRVRVANTRVDRLFSDAPHGVALLDQRGTVLRVNRSLADLLRIEEQLLEGTRLTRRQAPGTTGITDLMAELGTEADALCSGEVEVLSGDGRVVHAMLSLRRFSDDGPHGLMMANVVDISERRDYEDRLAHLADHDPVTGRANRRRFERELSAHQEECRLHGPRGALLLIDLDHFKQVNDTLGHAAGDQLLVNIGHLLDTSVEGDDLVARIGGDEFAVLLPSSDQLQAQEIAERMVVRVAVLAARLNGPARRVSASVGVVTFAAAAERGGDVLSLADMTMYDAKEAGRGRVAVLREGERNAPALALRMGWQSRLEHALDEDRFELHLQPIRDLETGRVQAAEALLRLVEDGQVIGPGEFLPVAEAVGMMPRIDAWVVERGVELLARMRLRDPRFIVEVNLSGLSLGDPHVEGAITRALARHPHVTCGLVLEVTETAAVADADRARAFAERMTALGCEFAIDDFGTGFGSFGYLKRLHFNYVKIDGEFVEAAPTSTVDRAIVHSVVELARTLGKRTIAEYVSSQEILDVMKAEGVDFAQGHLIGPPMPFDDFVAQFATPGGVQ